MNTRTVLDDLCKLASEASKAGRPGYDRRMDEARKIIDSFLKPPPPPEAVSALMDSLTQRRDEQHQPGSMAWGIYEAAIKRLPPIVRAPRWRGFFRPKIKPRS